MASAYLSTFIFTGNLEAALKPVLWKNTFMRKGYMFKTYEGKIIQSGFKANVQSNEFNFSVTKESVAQTLLNNAGREVEVHYVEYFGALPGAG